jgi:hypothetical protein
MLFLALYYKTHYAGLYIGVILAQLLRHIKITSLSDNQSSLSLISVVSIFMLLAWKGQSEPNGSPLIKRLK